MTRKESVEILTEENQFWIKRIVYKEIVDGDLKKFQAKSNDKPNGGGARDLRFSPYGEFIEVFKEMLPNKRDKICSGEVHWIENGNEVVKTMEFKPPTNSRYNEGRIANVNVCIPKISMEYGSQDDIVLLLIQRVDNQVWVHFTTKRSLEEDDSWNEYVRSEILRAFKAKRRANVAVNGYIDFTNQRSYTNGE